MVFLSNGFWNHSLHLILKDMIYGGIWEPSCYKQVSQCSENPGALGVIVDD